MDFSGLIDRGQLKKEETSKADIANFLQFAENEISAAKFNLEKFPLTAYKSAYDALIHAGVALIRFHGFRPTTKYTHVTIVDFVEKVIGKEYSDLAKAFKRMRRKRHPLQYEAKFIESQEEIRKSIEKAEGLVKRIEEFTGIKPRQKVFF
ncbi:MAG TPA: HEPN domain-containing protein [Candidatus Omnitrophota bacterium]|nr:HEPN domain-containing protein [Candidatus Omnitrophota bacterium]